MDNGIKEVAVVGTGLIGSSWITLFATKGYNVKAYSRKAETRTEGLKKVQSNLDFLVEKGLLSKDDKDQALARIKVVAEISEAVKDADFVQEATAEDYEVKKTVFKEMDKYSQQSTILASSSSGLSMTEIQQVVTNKGRCIIAHPWNPPHLIPLVEIVPGKQTSEETVNKTFKFMADLGKVPVIVRKDILGFIGNRLCAALWREAVDLVIKGVATVEDVDKAVYAGPGIRWALMGPFLTYHLGGGEVGGLGHFIDSISNMTFKKIVPTLATWDYIDEPTKKKLIEGVKEEIKGKNFKDIVKWRDDKLTELLKIIYG